MIMFYIFSLIIGIGLVKSSVQAIQEKKWLDLVSLLLLVPFFLFFFISVLWGGSAFNDAQADYEFYQEGHYYLESHGDYTEVTCIQYLLMMLLQIVGLSSIFLSLVWAAVREIIKIRKS